MTFAAPLAPPRRPWLLGTGLAVSVIALVKLLLHLYAGRHYGYFVDELYYPVSYTHLFNPVANGIARPCVVWNESSAA